MKLPQKIGFLLAFLFLLAGSGTQTRADEGNPGDFIHTRTYIGVEGTSVSVDNTGIFNGLNYSIVYNPTYEVDLLPALAQNFGFGVLLGHREEAWAVEVSFWQSNHNATFGPGVVVDNPSGGSVTFNQQFQDVAVYNSINVDFKRYFITESQIQPFVNLGVCFPWIVVNNAAANANYDVTSLTLAGLGLDLGAGVEYYLSPTLSFFGGAYRRWASFDEFKGFSLEYNQVDQNGPSPTDATGGFDFAVGTSLGFE